MIRRDTSILRRGAGRRPLVVVRVRRDCPLTRRVARRMGAAGRPAAWIAAALGTTARRVTAWLAAEAVWGGMFGEAGE